MPPRSQEPRRHTAQGGIPVILRICLQPLNLAIPSSAVQAAATQQAAQQATATQQAAQQAAAAQHAAQAQQAAAA